MKTNYLLTVGLPLALSGALLAGCGQQQTQTEPTTPVAQTVADAPEGSTAKGTEETGHEHPDDAMGAMKTRTHTTKLAFSSEPTAIPVGKPATWTLKISDAKSGAPVNDFEVEMTKLMHLIVVKNDLSWFNHIHPTLQGNGKFTVTTTLPSAGSYKLYADYTLKGKGQEVPQYELATGDEQPTPTSVLLVPDKMNGMWLVNKFNAHPEGEPDKKGGPVYEVALMPMPMPVVAGQDLMLHFQIRDAKGRPVKDLQPYLGAMGHCVILSSDTNSYLHSHPMGSDMKGMNHDMSGMKMDGDMKGMKMDAAPKSGGPDVIFHTNFPAPGVYKVWGQFQHKGQIITAAFVVRAAAGSVKSAASSSGAAAQNVIYTCPMHPEVRSNKPGNCPKCGMALTRRAS